MFTCTAGDLFEIQKSAGQPVDEMQLNADYICAAFGLLEYDAIGLGEKDFAFGAGYLKEQAAEHGLRFVSTNAKDRKTGELLFAPYVVKERAGVRVGFLSVVSPERHIIAQVESDLLNYEIEFEDPTAALLRYLPEVRKSADVVVLLSHAGIETSKYFAEDVPVDVVVIGHYPAVQDNPEKVGNAIVAMAGSKSDRFGTLHLDLSKDRKEIAAFRGDAIRLLKTGAQNGKLAALGLEWDEAVKNLRRDLQLSHQRARDEEAKKNDSKDIHARNGVFGAESCKSCHQPTYDSWVETPHATAFARLAEADAWDNPECIGCHVTGVAEKHYVADVNVAPELWNVQCEECHGLGSAHARDGSYVTQGEATCRKCHDPENSPEFDYALYSKYGVH